MSHDMPDPFMEGRAVDAREIIEHLSAMLEDQINQTNESHARECRLEARLALLEKVVEAAKDMPICVHGSHYPSNCPDRFLRMALAALSAEGDGEGK